MDNSVFPVLVPILEFASRGQFYPFLKLLQSKINDTSEINQNSFDVLDSRGYSIIHHLILQVPPC